MIYLLIIIWRIVLLFYYLTVDSIYFLIFFRARFLEPVSTNKKRNKLRRQELNHEDWSEGGKEYKNIYHYILKPIKL